MNYDCHLTPPKSSEVAILLNLSHTKVIDNINLKRYTCLTLTFEKNSDNLLDYSSAARFDPSINSAVFVQLDLE